MAKRMECLLIGICLALCTFGTPQSALGQQQSGTLVLDLKNYTSDGKLAKKTVQKFEYAGLQWGMFDKTVLIPMVKREFLRVDTPYFTRFGEQKVLLLEPGQYTITCIGYDFSSMSSDIEKGLAKSAFFNNEVVTFNVLPGKVTTLEISPFYETKSMWHALTKFTVAVADLNVRVLEDGTSKDEGTTINRRTDQSVAWDDYHGPLKF